MNRSYRLGLLIVAGTILAAAAVIAAAGAFARPSTPARAGQDLGDSGYPLGSFRLTERSGRAVTEADLAGDVWVAAFIFTRCPLSCPRISSVMKGLQDPLNAAGVKLVSLSVDPDFDTPEVLTRYANGLGATRDGWWFLTGPEAAIHALIYDRFKNPVSRIPEAERRPGLENVTHSDRLVLVDRGNTVIGFFDSTETAAVRDLLARAKRLGGKAAPAPAWARRLPAVNAALNGTCAVLLLLGWTLILTRRARGHAACMISAVVTSAVFLGCYLTYHFQVGSVPFLGKGPIRFVYFTILLSHTVLATFGVVPLVALTLTRALRKQFHRHASIARVTFPIWLYVSITGVVIYWMLYQMPGGSA